MTLTNEDFQFTLTQFFLRDEASETPEIHPQKIQMSKGTIQNKIMALLAEYKAKEIEVDLAPLEETLRRLRKIKAAEYKELVAQIEENVWQLS